MNIETRMRPSGRLSSLYQRAWDTLIDAEEQLNRSHQMRLCRSVQLKGFQ